MKSWILSGECLSRVNGVGILAFRAATSFIPEIKEAINKSEVLTKTDFKSYDGVKAMCKKFNKAANNYVSFMTFHERKTRILIFSINQ